MGYLQRERHFSILKMNMSVNHSFHPIIHIMNRISPYFIRESLQAEILLNLLCCLSGRKLRIVDPHIVIKRDLSIKAYETIIRIFIHQPCIGGLYKPRFVQYYFINRIIYYTKKIMNISTPLHKKEPVNTPQAGMPTGSDKLRCSSLYDMRTVWYSRAKSSPRRSSAVPSRR